MVLYINTKDQRQVTVSLKDEGKIVKSLTEKNEFGSQVLLPLIIKLIRAYTLEVYAQTDEKGGWGIVDSIEVEVGPGSYTGLKVGVAIANALGYSLGIPVNGKKMETDLVY